jgi:uncharacterized DUF497 family protein
MKLKFEWDKAKAKSNYAKHGVSFDLAKEVFLDAFAIEFVDERVDYDEERFVILGVVGSQLLYVAFTERNEIIRIISARRATKHEQEAYFQQDPQGDSSDDTKRH